MTANSKEMADASFTMEAIGKALLKRGVTSATIDQAMKWVEEDQKQDDSQIGETIKIKFSALEAIKTAFKKLREGKQIASR